VYDLPREVQGDREEVRELYAMVVVPQQSPCINLKQAIANEVLRPRNSSSRREIRKAVEALNGAPRPLPPLLQRAIGNDLEQLRMRSPVSHAGSIKAKVLLVHQFADK